MDSISGEIQANIVDIEQREIGFGVLRWRDGTIVEVDLRGEERAGEPYLIPGLVDAHVHIESSMLTPGEFARMAVVHGTLGTVSDPHEIANVLGMAGVKYMLNDASGTPFQIVFGAPSCVPATPFETAGAGLGVEEVEALLREPGVGYLSEVMNYPGVLADDPSVMDKVRAARALGMPVDGHAPGLYGEYAERYAAAGITTDHECFSLDEARGKLAAGMSILIREGSAARNFDTLHALIDEFPDRVMFCSDDKHPDDLLEGHIDRLAARAVALGHDPLDVLRCASLNPIRHYGVDLGLLRPGDRMDAVLVEDLQAFKAAKAWLRGALVAERGKTLLLYSAGSVMNRFEAIPVTVDELKIESRGDEIRVIDAIDGELITREAVVKPLLRNGCLVPDPARDLLQICVINRYQPAPPASAFVRGFGLQRGALASSVAHDSHNLLAVGADQAALAAAINAVIEAGGGVAVADGERVEMLPLPVAGLMSNLEGPWVAQRYAELDSLAKSLGSSLRAPFMTLSFMALLVIPDLKLSDKGLFDGRDFRFTPLQV